MHYLVAIRRHRELLRGAALLFLAGICCAILVPAASAAEACPNEAFRTGPAAGLPECRAYEMVSPTAKNSSDVEPISTTQTTPAGDAAIFPSTTAFPGAETSLIMNYFRAIRGSGQWATRQLDSPQLNVGSQVFLTSLATSEDLTKTLQVSLEALAPGAIKGNGNVYLRDNETGERTLVVTGPSHIFDEAASPGISNFFRGATPDLSRILFWSPAKLTDDAVEGSSLYLWSSEEGLRVVNALPGGAPSPGGSNITARERTQAISADGNRVVFEPGSGGFFTGGPLYLWEDGGETKAITVSQRAGADSEPKEAQFSAISEDGSKVFFTSGTRLTDDSTTAGYRDLYRYDVASETLEDLTIPGAGEEGGQVQQFLGLSPDGDRAYYMALGVMAPGATPGFGNIYEWHDGTTTTVASLDPNPVLAENIFLSLVSVSPSANHISFTSYAQPTGYDNTSPACEALVGDGIPAGICGEVYTWDAASAELDCASCNFTQPPGGHSSLTRDVRTVSNYESRATLDDGRVFFNTRDALSPADTNGKVDVYQWDHGSVSLISSGAGTTDSTFSDASVDGSGVFFATSQRLVPQDIDDNVDIYDARVGGGLIDQMANPELEGSVCAGEGCREAATGARARAQTGTDHFAGPANGNARKPRKRCLKPRKRSGAKAKHGSKAKGSKAKCRQSGGKKSKQANARKHAADNTRSGK